MPAGAPGHPRCHASTGWKAHWLPGLGTLAGMTDQDVSDRSEYRSPCVERHGSGRAELG